jgi:hypothetical protein
MVDGCGMPGADAVRTVPFVCQHGASRGRMAAALVVAIDCDVAGAARWDLAVAEPCEAMRDELAVRATALARALAPTRAREGER